MFEKKYRNERDVEIPVLLAAVARWQPKSLLDVGGWSALYAQSLRDALPKGAKYTVCDPQRDETVAAVVDRYIEGDVMNIRRQKFECVTSISVLEHVGVKPVTHDDMEERQIAFFRRLLSLAERSLFVTFPYGATGLVRGEYANVTRGLLGRLVPELEHYAAHFYYNEGAQLGRDWSEIELGEASKVELDESRGVRCICILMVDKNA